MTTQTSLYKDLTTDLNSAWRTMVQRYSLGDYCVSYLRTFELCLSPCCPDQMLWKFEEYEALQRMEPLPDDDDNLRVSGRVYRHYIMVYEQIMRTVGLIDKAPLELAKEDDDIQLVDLGGFRWAGRRPRGSTATCSSPEPYG